MINDLLLETIHRPNFGDKIVQFKLLTPWVVFDIILQIATYDTVVESHCK